MATARARDPGPAAPPRTLKRRKHDAWVQRVLAYAYERLPQRQATALAVEIAQAGEPPYPPPLRGRLDALDKLRRGIRDLPIDAAQREMLLPLGDAAAWQQPPGGVPARVVGEAEIESYVVDRARKIG